MKNMRKDLWIAESNIKIRCDAIWTDNGREKLIVSTCLEDLDLHEPSSVFFSCVQRFVQFLVLPAVSFELLGTYPIQIPDKPQNSILLGVKIWEI